MSGISRRELFRSMFGRRIASQPVTESELPVSPPPAVWKPDLAGNQNGDTSQLALILDRFCLAHQGSFCSVCSERCPELGAIQTENGKPRINPEFCTGCKICHDVCPAPKNAVFFVSRAPRSGMIGRTVTETQPDSHV
ncbi:MAG: 4Fe-4S binding protein [Luteolibacter sp.]